MNLIAQVLPNGNLVFPPFRAEDYRQEVHAQVYVCLARNPVGSVLSRDVNVRAGPYPHRCAPTPTPSTKTGGRGHNSRHVAISGVVK